jgi:hypothetical protein
MPDIRSWTSSPIRNRVRVELRAPVNETWKLVGDLARFPEYSSGLERVEAMKNAEGVPTQYVCHFKPLQEGAAGIEHREFVRWVRALVRAAAWIRVERGGRQCIWSEE